MNTITTRALGAELAVLEQRGLAAAFRALAAARPEARAMTFLDHTTSWEGETLHLSRRELDTRARILAGRLLDHAVPGDRVAILCPNGPGYVAAFLGCLYAGLLPVPLLPPDLQRQSERLAPTLADAAPGAVITLEAHREPVEAALAAVTGPAARARVLTADDLGAAPTPASGPPPGAVEPGATAYLQYTSGSTRKPNGVQVTHRNIAVSVAQHVDRQRIAEDSTIVNWLPFFHDMGLVFALVLPLAVGIPAVQLTPQAFIQRPARWLRQFGTYGGTHAMIPNFALDVCVDAVPEGERAGVDLSTVRYLGNASEPVRAASLSRFTRVYAPHGFRHTAHSPCWGLAEATLIVTGDGAEMPPVVMGFDREALADGRVVPCPETEPDARRLVGCGAPFQGQRVRVVHPGTDAPAPSGTVGELWVSGENVCDGYWLHDGSDPTFQGTLDGGGRWLRTGDLGFVHDGQIFIAGRAKDVLIVDGRNHHAIDIEVTVEQVSPAVRRGHIAAFAVETGESELAVAVVELRPEAEAVTDTEALRAAVRAAVAEAHDVELYDIALVSRATIPKTSSGKLRRRICRDLYVRGELAAQAVARDRAPR
ncbi:fatty acyl-AMP ligase [Streptomyces sp. NPDC048172]|uniref:fatty acyl-AMP ligase n=1 Tax=Streptomyces sp. NPDC048172 TaxID=3365505 RepID=UPI003711A86D